MEIILIAIMTIGLGSQVLSQASSDEAFPRGVNRQFELDPDRVRKISSVLQGPSKKWVDLPRLYYDQTYDKRLPDLIIYVRKVGTIDSVSFALIQENRLVHNLFGQRYLWVMVFTDRNLNCPRRSGQTDTLRFALEQSSKRGDAEVEIKKTFNIDLTTDSIAFKIQRQSLEYQEEPATRTIGGIINLVTTALAGSSVGAGSKGESITDTTQPMAMGTQQLIGVANTDSLFANVVKFKLALNTNNRISVRPEATLTFQNFNYNFVNAEKSWLGASIAVGYTPTPADMVQLYLLGHVYVERPLEPVRSTCWGLVFGTNVFNKSLLSHIVLGIGASLGYLLEDQFGGAGVFIGVNGSASSTPKRYIFQYCIGIDYRL